MRTAQRRWRFHEDIRERLGAFGGDVADLDTVLGIVPGEHEDLAGAFDRRKEGDVLDRDGEFFKGVGSEPLDPTGQLPGGAMGPAAGGEQADEVVGVEDEEFQLHRLGEGVDRLIERDEVLVAKKAGQGDIVIEREAAESHRDASIAGLTGVGTCPILPGVGPPRYTPVLPATMRASSRVVGFGSSAGTSLDTVNGRVGRERLRALLRFPDRS